MTEYCHNRVREAVILASIAHSEDKWGDKPYLTHLALTAFEVSLLSDRNEFLCAAWLHDVLEDHPQQREEIVIQFPEIVGTLDTVSKRKNESYTEFIDRVLESGDDGAILVKYADMKTNLENDPSPRLRAKYEPHFVRLQDSVLRIITRRHHNKSSRLTGRH